MTSSAVSKAMPHLRKIKENSENNQGLEKSLAELMFKKKPTTCRTVTEQRC